MSPCTSHSVHEVKLPLQPIDSKYFGSPAWIRTTIHGSKGRCPTIRRPGNLPPVYRPNLPICNDLLQSPRKPFLAGAGPGLQTRCAVLCVAGGFDSHWLPPSPPNVRSHTNPLPPPAFSPLFWRNLKVEKQNVSSPAVPVARLCDFRPRHRNRRGRLRPSRHTLFGRH